jgi:uncharacterized membrane protein YhaH (DUF805 family)
LNFTDAIKTVFSKYAQFGGRACRPEYWYWILAMVLVSVVLTLVEGAVLAPALGFESFSPDAGQPLHFLMVLVIFVPSLAVSVRRLHDGGRSGWWIFIQVLPVIGSLVLLWWYIQPGDETVNEYGPPHLANAGS